MATEQKFGNMLQAYAPNKLFREELVKRDWFLSNVEHDQSWVSDEIDVRFKAGQASSVRFGKLTKEDNIGSSKFVKGKIDKQPEVWGSMIFNEKDLMKNGKLSEQNFLKILPGEVEDFTDFMKMALSMSFTNGPALAKRAAPAAGVTEDAANGVIAVDRIERLELDQKVIIKGGTAAAVECYVKEINMEEDLVTFVTVREGATPRDLSAHTVADGATLFLDGQETTANQLTNLKSSLLSAKNGGSATLYGVSKLASPFTQAINIPGSTVSASNILDKLFEAQNIVRQKGKGNANVALMSYKHLGSILAKLEAVKGAYRQASDMKASLYGWTEVVIAGVKGQIKVVAIQEMDDDFIALLDMSALKLYSNGFIKKRVSPDGIEYHVIRSEDGYKYIVDLCFFGDMVLERPSRCGIIFGIKY